MKNTCSCLTADESVQCSEESMERASQCCNRVPSHISNLLPSINIPPCKEAKLGLSNLSIHSQFGVLYLNGIIRHVSNRNKNATELHVCALAPSI